MAIVVIEVQVVHGVARGAVDYRGVGYVFAVIYDDVSPDHEHRGLCQEGCNSMDIRMNTVQKLMKMKRAMYANFCNGNKYGYT